MGLVAWAFPVCVLINEEFSLKEDRKESVKGLIVFDH